MASNYMVQQIWYIKVKLYYAILQVGTFGALLSFSYSTKYMAISKGPNEFKMILGYLFSWVDQIICFPPI